MLIIDPIISAFLLSTLTTFLGTFIFLKHSRPTLTHFQRDYTPTAQRPKIMPFGGIFILLGINVSLTLLMLGQHQWEFEVNYSIILPVGLVMVNFLVGLVDDFGKLAKVSAKQEANSSPGMSAKSKLALQFAGAIAFVYSIREVSLMDGLNFINPLTGLIFHLDIPKYLEFAIEVLAIVSTVNALNLTDGLDGLAGKQALLAMAFLLAFSLVFISAATELHMLTSAAIGAVVGFLIFNSHPARIFMGDAGSMALGSLLSALFVLYGIEINIIFICIVLVAEASSTFLQVFSYKTFKRRIFRMAPIHHHYQLKGIKSNKIVETMFLISTITVFCYIISIVP